jgi:hypothetical protein
MTFIEFFRAADLLRRVDDDVWTRRVRLMMPQRTARAAFINSKPWAAR